MNASQSRSQIGCTGEIPMGTRMRRAEREGQRGRQEIIDLLFHRVIARVSDRVVSCLALPCRTVFYRIITVSCCIVPFCNVPGTPLYRVAPFGVMNRTVFSRAVPYCIVTLPCRVVSYRSVTYQLLVCIVPHRFV